MARRAAIPGGASCACAVPRSAVGFYVQLICDGAARCGRCESGAGKEKGTIRERRRDLKQEKKQWQSFAHVDVAREFRQIIRIDKGTTRRMASPDRPTDRISPRKMRANGGDFDGVLAELKEKREKINNAIEAIEELA